MNEYTPENQLQVNPKHLQELIRLANLNVQNVLKAKATSYGAVCGSSTDGNYTNDLLCSVIPGTSVRITTGYTITEINGEILINHVPETDVPMAAYGSGTYYIYIVPKKIEYENGLLTFTNGSKTVIITADPTLGEGDFTKLSPFEYLIIHDGT